MSTALFHDEAVLDDATLWSDAVHEGACMDTEAVSGLWETCDTAERMRLFLTTIDANICRIFVFNYLLKVWQSKSEKDRKVLQMYANSA